MCQECGQQPCSSLYPNAAAVSAIGRCSYCREAIAAGEEYIEFDGELYHLECLEDNAAEILIENHGAVKGIAETEW